MTNRNIILKDRVMSKKKPYNVTSNKIDDLKWDDLIQMSNEITSTLDTTGKKFVELVETIRTDVKDDVTIFKIIDGVSNSIIELKNRISKLYKLHSKEIDGVRHTYTGVVKVDNDNHSKLYLNLITAYTALGQDLQNLTGSGIAAVMTRYEEVLSVKENKDK